MANNYFQFKKFTIRQEKCAMKVGTDGVLLGAWVKVSDTQKILDIGTGTGLIAIMLAQRSNAQIDAIEINKIAAKQAAENILSCPWHTRIRVFPLSMQKFMVGQDLKYDLVVSNPPYFTNSYANPDAERKLARHDDMLNLDELFSGISKLLSANGRFAVIYPAEMLGLLQNKASENKLHLNRLTEVYPTPQKRSSRILAEFSFQQGIDERSKLIIEDKGRHKYSKEYIEMTKDFYL